MDLQSTIHSEIKQKQQQTNKSIHDEALSHKTELFLTNF